LGGVCLLLTVGISLLLPELRTRLHNKIVLTHNICLMIAHFTWGGNLLSKEPHIPACTAIGKFHTSYYLYSVRDLERSELGGSHGCPG